MISESRIALGERKAYLERLCQRLSMGLAFHSNIGLSSD